MEIFVDIDNTICKTIGMDYVNSTPRSEIISIVNKMFNKGYKITLWTSRGVGSGIDWRKLTEKQLNEWGVKYTTLRLDKPVYKVFIDDKSILPNLNGLETKINDILYKKRFFIHIPKNGGTSICNKIGQVWYHVPWSFEHGDAFTVIRNPYNFYLSLYNFFIVKYNTISNQMKEIAKKNTFGDFVSIIIHPDSLKKYCDKNNIKLASYDSGFIQERENIGFYTYYIKYFCNPANKKSIQEVITYINDNLLILYFENLKEELMVKAGIDIGNTFINKIKKVKTTMSKDTKNLIYSKEKHIFNAYYSVV